MTEIKTLYLGLTACFVCSACAPPTPTDWELASRANTPAAYEQFVASHPGSTYAAQAMERIANVDMRKAEAALRAVERWHLEQLLPSGRVLHFDEQARARAMAERIGTRLILKEVRVKGFLKDHPPLVKGITFTETGLRTEFPHDGIMFGMDINNPIGADGRFELSVPLAMEGYIHRYSGKSELKAGESRWLIGEGAKFDRLSFAPIQDAGYVYVRGKGKVVLENGREILLGY